MLIIDGVTCRMPTRGAGSGLTAWIRGVHFGLDADLSNSPGWQGGGSSQRRRFRIVRQRSLGGRDFLHQHSRPSPCKQQGLRRASGFRRQGESWRLGSQVLDLADCTPSAGWDGECSRFEGFRPINISSEGSVCISGRTSSVAPEGGKGQSEVTRGRRVGEPTRTPHARFAADASRKGRKRNADVGAGGLRALHHHDRLRIFHAAGRAGLGSVAA
jgi:hypothetical protein